MPDFQAAPHCPQQGPSGKSSQQTLKKAIISVLSVLTVFSYFPWESLGGEYSVPFFLSLVMQEAKKKKMWGRKTEQFVSWASVPLVRVRCYFCVFHFYLGP